MKKKLRFLFFLFASIFLILFGLAYKLLLADNVIDIAGAKNRILYIHTGYTYDSVLAVLQREKMLKNMKSFEWIADKMHYKEHVRAGRYILSNYAGTLMIVRKLRNGQQDPVRITFNNIQNKDQLADKISQKIEATKPELLREFNDPHFLDSLDLTEDNFPTIFLANTYEFYWNTSARQFIERMLKEYNKFWNEERVKKAQALGLSPTEITILASIIQKESTHYDEYPTIAGVYINRLHRSMPLQADPTIVFALNKLGEKRRVYKEDLKIQSPYNTYTNAGLPPGPICIPEMKSIDETLNAEDHNYLYFCARDDFSGYSVFAATWEEHLENARRYQKALNDRNIH